LQYATSSSEEAIAELEERWNTRAADTHEREAIVKHLRRYSDALDNAARERRAEYNSMLAEIDDTIGRLISRITEEIKNGKHLWWNK
jgi:hypothetical protein